MSRLNVVSPTKQTAKLAAELNRGVDSIESWFERETATGLGRGAELEAEIYTRSGRSQLCTLPSRGALHGQTDRRTRVGEGASVRHEYVHAATELPDESQGARGGEEDRGGPLP